MLTGILLAVLVVYIAADAAMTYTIVRVHGWYGAALKVRSLFVR